VSSRRNVRKDLRSDAATNSASRRILRKAARNEKDAFNGNPTPPGFIIISVNIYAFNFNCLSTKDIVVMERLPKMKVTNQVKILHQDVFGGCASRTKNIQPWV